LNILAYRDIGKLTVSENSIEFHGSKETVVVTDIKRVAFGKQGRDFVNNWVKIEYGESTTPSVAFFADGSLLGWGGIFGGNEEHPGNGGTTLSSRRWASKAISDENQGNFTQNSTQRSS